MLLACRKLLCAALSLFASLPSTALEQFLQTITNEIEAASPDKDLARQIERTQLNEQLSENEVRWLSTAGAGTAVIKALHRLQQHTTSRPVPAQPVIAFEPRPTPDEVQSILRQVTSYVSHYTAALVDFTCIVTTQTYTKEMAQSRPLSDTSIVITAPSNWQGRRTVTQEINYYRNREYYSNDGQTKTNDGRSLTPGASWSDGEFAHTLRITFAPASQGRFVWDHWERHSGKKLAVFSYSVEAAHSQLSIDTQIFRSGLWQNAQLNPAYQGFFYADPDSGAIHRLIANTEAISSDYAMNNGKTVLDYGPVEIAGKTYLLLTGAQSYISTKQYQTLFQKTFVQYRKFEGESKIVGLGSIH